MDDSTDTKLQECRKILAMLDRMPARYSRTEPTPDPEFVRYYQLGKAHIDLDAVDRIAREVIHKARKRYRQATAFRRRPE